jgi:UDP-N-acetylmuramyl tripeptide synthase
MAQEQQVVPFTLADRDRIARTEMKIEALESELNVKFEAVNGRFDAVNGRFEELESKMDTKFEVVFWILGVMLSLILFILGYTIWDRRTALRPALEKANYADEKSSKAITILRELAQKYPEIVEKLKMHGLW